MDHLRFEPGDFADILPDPGTYPARVAEARLRDSRSGNPMLAVLFELDSSLAPHDRVADYFVIGGASPRALRTARMRLVQLYHACAIEVRAGDRIEPGDLFGCAVVIDVRHDEFRGEKRLKATRYYHPEQAPPPF